MITPKNLLIVRTDRIGDVILSLPLAEIVKKKYSDCKVTFLVKSYTKVLAESNPFIDEVLTLKETGGKIKLGENVKLLKEKSFDSSIIVYPTFITALIVFLSGIKIRIGSGYRWYSFLFNKRIYEHRKFAGRHELEFNVNLLKIFGIERDVSPSKVEFNLHVDERSLSKVKSVLRSDSVDLNKKIVIVHPGSGGSAIDLPLEKFSLLVKYLASLNDINVIITGSEDEREICSKIIRKSTAINFSGRFDLSELVALTSMCTLFITNSTGPIHIAAALNKFTIGFYPKILSCSVNRWGPYTTKKAVFTPEIECNNCTREQCERLNCMNSIDIDKVFEIAKKVLTT